MERKHALAEDDKCESSELRSNFHRRLAPERSRRSSPSLASGRDHLVLSQELVALRSANGS